MRWAVRDIGRGELAEARLQKKMYYLGWKILK
jgi:hypothetical protein